MTRLIWPLLWLVACGPNPVTTDPTDTVTSTMSTSSEVPPPGVDLSDGLKEIRQNSGIPSLVAAVADANGVLAAGANGKRVEGESDKVTWEDSYHLGSVTKAMTATLVGRLVDEGHIGWDTTLDEVFDGVDPGWAGVTIEMLARHEGGATGSIAITHPDLWADLWAAGSEDVVGIRSAFATEMLGAPPENTPGDAVYANAGFMLIGAMLEAEMGQAWEDLLTEWVLTPLDMGACGFGAPMGEGPFDQPWGHALGGDGLPDPMDPADPYSDNPPALGPAGTLHCPMVEFSRFGSAHLAAASGDTNFLSAESALVLHTPGDSGFTAGMLGDDTQPWSNGPALAMNGSNTLWFATIWIAPGIDRVYVSATNYGTSSAVNATNDAVLHMIDGGL